MESLSYRGIPLLDKLRELGLDRSFTELSGQCDPPLGPAPGRLFLAVSYACPCGNRETFCVSMLFSLLQNFDQVLRGIVLKFNSAAAEHEAEFRAQNQKPDLATFLDQVCLIPRS